jgi:hypothetical protein
MGTGSSLGRGVLTALPTWGERHDVPSLDLSCPDYAEGHRLTKVFPGSPTNGGDREAAEGSLPGGPVIDHAGARSQARNDLAGAVSFREADAGAAA